MWPITRKVYQSLTISKINFFPVSTKGRDSALHPAEGSHCIWDKWCRKSEQLASSHNLPQLPGHSAHSDHFPGTGKYSHSNKTTSWEKFQYSLWWTWEDKKLFLSETFNIPSLRKNKVWKWWVLCYLLIFLAGLCRYFKIQILCLSCFA